MAIDRRGSQTIAGDRTWFYLLRSSAITIAGSQTIAEVCFHMIADDRRPYCDLRSAIRDHMETSLNLFNEISKDNLSPLPANGKTIII